MLLLMLSEVWQYCIACMMCNVIAWLQPVTMFIKPLIDWLIDLFIYWLIDLFIYLFIYLLIDWLIDSLTDWLQFTIVVILTVGCGVLVTANTRNVCPRVWLPV